MFKARRFLRTLPTRVSPLVKKITTLRKKVVNFADRKPFLSFLILLGILLFLIILSNLFKKAVVESNKEPLVKSVAIYQIGSAPKITVQAKIKKTGVITISALTSGVVSQIYKVEGDPINKGDWLVAMASNYQGGNVLSLQRQIAGTQYQNVKDSYPIQKEIIDKQKEVANKSEQQASDLRAISEQSVSESQNLINLNESILTSIDSNLQVLEQNPIVNKDLILSTKQLKSQYISANNLAKASLRSTQYSANNDKPPAEIARLQKDITLKQLDIQQKQLDLNKEVSRLQLVLAQVTEGVMFPSSPFNGIVQRVLVKENQAVTPGTPLLIISQNIEDDPISAIAFVSREIAQRTSILEPSILYLGSEVYESVPSFISTEAVEGSLYAIYYPIPDSFNPEITSDGYIRVEIPIGYPDTSSAVPFIPLDSIYMTREKSYLFVVRNGKAQAKVVNLGQVYGSFVEIEEGIETGDQVIVDRNVIEGDSVSVKK